MSPQSGSGGGDSGNRARSDSSPEYMPPSHPYHQYQYEQRFNDAKADIPGPGEDGAPPLYDEDVGPPLYRPRSPLSNFEEVAREHDESARSYIPDDGRQPACPLRRLRPPAQRAETELGAPPPYNGTSARRRTVHSVASLEITYVPVADRFTESPLEATDSMEGNPIGGSAGQHLPRTNNSSGSQGNSAAGGGRNYSAASQPGGSQSNSQNSKGKPNGR